MTTPFTAHIGHFLINRRLQCYRAIYWWGNRGVDFATCDWRQWLLSDVKIKQTIIQNLNVKCMPVFSLPSIGIYVLGVLNDALAVCSFILTKWIMDLDIPHKYLELTTRFLMVTMILVFFKYFRYPLWRHMKYRCVISYFITECKCFLSNWDDHTIIQSLNIDVMGYDY